MRSTITKGLVVVSAAAGLALMTAGPAFAAGTADQPVSSEAPASNSGSTIIGHVEGSPRNQIEDHGTSQTSGGVDIGGALTIEQPELVEPVAVTAPVPAATAEPAPSAAPQQPAPPPVSSPDLHVHRAPEDLSGFKPPTPEVTTAPVTTTPVPVSQPAPAMQVASLQGPELANADPKPAPVYTGADVLALVVGALALAAVGTVRHFLRRSYHWR